MVVELALIFQNMSNSGSNYIVLEYNSISIGVIMLYIYNVHISIHRLSDNVKYDKTHNNFVTHRAVTYHVKYWHFGTVDWKVISDTLWFDTINSSRSP